LIRLAVHRGASIKPPGDVLVVTTFNQDADRVLSIADAAQEQGIVSVATSKLSSILDPECGRVLANDVDEVLWEEAETTSCHQGQCRPTIAFNGFGRRSCGDRPGCSRGRRPLK
jgi:hypothetical protein